jgi:hypothetical protein
VELVVVGFMQKLGQFDMAGLQLPVQFRDLLPYDDITGTASFRAALGFGLCLGLCHCELPPTF